MESLACFTYNVDGCLYSRRLNVLQKTSHHRSVLTVGRVKAIQQKYIRYMQHFTVQCAYIMGINHPVRNFDGRVIAIVRRNGGKGIVWVVAPKSTRFIINDIRDAIDFAEGKNGYSIDCLFERSCGAVIFREENEKIKYLLIRNRRSAHWGFPKGHVEPGETDEETAIREVYEETGLNIDILPGFVKKSDYTIQGKIEKSVSIFLAKTTETSYTLQVEEIEECGWFDYDSAMLTLNYENDKLILIEAKNYLDNNYLKEN